MRRLFLATATLFGLGLSQFGVAVSVARATPTGEPVVTISNTASVRHAKVGDEVTFTSVATNNSPNPVGFYVQTAYALDGLKFDLVGCDRVSNDGTFCEYSLVQPGQAVTQTVRARVQATGSRRATETACVSNAEWYRANGPKLPALTPANVGPCASAMVRIIGKLR
jgi:hypothetical protein